MRSSSFLRTGLMLSVAFTVSPAAWAQGQAADAELDGAIIVTAQFREQRLQDTPIAITAASAEQLSARGQENVADLGEFAPNVNFSQSSSLVGNSLVAFIRGVGQFDSNFAMEPGVGIYVDDVYYGTTFGAVFDLTDLDRVEILRGPQGTLAGKNSLGGAVRMVSRRPDGGTDGYVQATYGSYDRMELRAGASFALADDLYARVSGMLKRSDGYFRRLDYDCVNPGSGIPPSPELRGSDCVIGTEGGQDIKALRLALRYAPAGSPLEINLVADIADDNSESVATKLLYADFPNVRSYDAGNPAGGVPFDGRFITGPRSYTSYANFGSGGNYSTFFGPTYQVVPGTFEVQPRSQARSHGLSATIDYRISDSLSLKSITAYRKAEGYAGIDVDGSPLAIVNQAYDMSHKQFTQELRLSAKVGDIADLTVGGFYYDADDVLANRTMIPVVIFDFLSNDPVKTTSISAFAHLEVYPTDRLTLIGGLRYTDDEKSYLFSRRNPDGSAISGVPLTQNFLLVGLDGEEGLYKGDRLDYRLGANYRFSPELMVYGQVATGFKGGGVNPRPYVPDQIRPFGPETLTSFEIGAKSNLGRAVQLNVAAFYNKFNDIQLTLLSCPESPCGLPANVGDADVKGLELEAVLRPVQGLTISGTMGYLDFDYTDFDASTGITADMRAPFVSEWQGSASVSYDILLSSGALTPRVDWTYQSSFYYNSVNNPFNLVDGRSLFNASLRYEHDDGDWSVTAAVTNLADKFHYVGMNENVVGYGVATGIVGRPREWSLTIGKRF